MKYGFRNKPYPNFETHFMKRFGDKPPRKESDPTYKVTLIPYGQVLSLWVVCWPSPPNNLFACPNLVDSPKPGAKVKYAHQLFIGNGHIESHKNWGLSPFSCAHG
jgi:hypothetical protein